MSILIKGMEMPPERQSLHIIIKYNGIVCDALSGEDVATAYELPPHGRLIDADKLKSDAYLEHDCVHKMMVFGGQMVYTESAIENAPTVIEAEDEK